MTIEHEHDRDQLAAYALGALDADEASALEVHLESCDRCRSLVSWLRPAVDLLPASVPRLEPPPALRDRLLVEVNAKAEAQVDERRRRPGTSRWREWRGFAWRPATALAAAVLLIAGAGAGYLLHTSDSQQSIVAARPTNAAPPGLVAATLERNGDLATLRVQRLPELPPNQVYETWLRRDGVLQPGSVFVLRRDGSADAAVPGSLAGAEAVLVTREPRGGSRTPTSPPLLEARLN